MSQRGLHRKSDISTISWALSVKSISGEKNEKKVYQVDGREDLGRARA